MQVALGGTFKDPGCFVQSTAVAKASPVTITATLSGTAALHTSQYQLERLQNPLIVPCSLSRLMTMSPG